jgi:hypothetical protein
LRVVVLAVAEMTGALAVEALVVIWLVLIYLLLLEQHTPLLLEQEGQR